MGGPLYIETAVEFSDYLPEIQLHDPTVKVLPAPIINHHINKETIDIALHTVTAPHMPANHKDVKLHMYPCYPLSFSHEVEIII